MSEFNRKSLVNKITLVTTAVAFAFLLLVSISYQQIGNRTLFDSEMEKAQFISDTAAQLLSVNLYLGLEQNIDQLIDRLIQNENILKVRLENGSKMIRESVRGDHDELEHAFSVVSDVYEPNSDRVIGTLHVTYSSLYYLKAVKQYQNFGLLMFVLFTAIIVLLSFYIKKLLAPLRAIRKLLLQYTPEQEIHFPFAERGDEIGLIASAFNRMQEKIAEFARMQHDIHSQLEEKVIEKTQEINRQFYYDALTGVPNRISLIESLKQNPEGALVIVNIDDFREINDFLGHHIGDRFLVQFAEALAQSVASHPQWLLCRLSGDEFAIHARTIRTIGELTACIDSLFETVETIRFSHDETEATITATIGATLQMDSAIEKSDIALKLARKQSKPYLLYDESYLVEDAYKTNIEWVKKLKDAIANDRLVPFFQPIFDNRTGAVVSYESLVRLLDADGTVIPPVQFLNIAKKSKLYSKLTRIVVEKSCRTFERLPYSFSVNLSFEDIADAQMTEYIIERVRHYGVERKIIFEILESEGIENYQEVSNFIDRMHAMGCKIAIDDFGSGYSNYEHLLKLHIDYIKVDGSLIKNIDLDRNAQIIVQTILDFAQKLEVSTVAEFVHSQSVHDYVKQLGIDRSQGFLLGQPNERVDAAAPEPPAV